jgi:hypothetical protein
MPCKIIAQASTRYAAKYQVQTHGRVYEARVEDHPGEDCVVHIGGIERGSELFRSIEGAVLKDWLGSDAAP